MYVRETELRPMRARLREISGRDISVRNCEGGIAFRGNNVQFQCSIPPMATDESQRGPCSYVPGIQNFLLTESFSRFWGLTGR